MLSHLRNLVMHAEWANAVFFHAWAKSPARDHEEMRRRVGHVVGVQDAFLAILTNGRVKGDGVGPHSDLLPEFPYLGPPHDLAPSRTLP